ncbi:MAG: hypothetical protein HYZ53_29480 [Planctomycetes bacterium]|nr:hypothetical protein [Planctomycetota bacterium]
MRHPSRLPRIVVALFPALLAVFALPGAGPAAQASPSSEAAGKLLARLAQAVGWTEADRLAARYGAEEAAGLFGRYGVAAGEELIRRYGEGIARVAARHGEAGVAAVRAVGARGVGFLERHPETGTRWLSRLGTEALEVEARYGVAGLRVLDELGPQGGKRFLELFGAEAPAAYARLGPQGAAAVLRDPQFPALWRAAVESGQGEAFLALAGRHGKAFLDFVRRNWASIGIAALIADFSLHSDRYLAVGGDVAVRGAQGFAGAAGPSGLVAISGLLLGYLFVTRRRRAPVTESTVRS